MDACPPEYWSGQAAGGHILGPAPAWRECLGYMVAESRLNGLKAKREELENEKDPQKPPESSRSSSAQRSNLTLIKETFCRKVLPYSPGWASINTFMFFLVPTECSNRCWPSCAIAGEDRPGWGEVCWGLRFAV